jgi:hypothetical protein
MAQAIQL